MDKNLLQTWIEMLCQIVIFFSLKHFPNEKFYTSEFKVFADDNFKFVEHGKKFSKSVENTVGKGEIARYEQFLLFTQCFQDFYCRHVKSGLVWEGVS